MDGLGDYLHATEKSKDCIFAKKIQVKIFMKLPNFVPIDLINLVCFNSN